MGIDSDRTHLDLSFALGNGPPDRNTTLLIGGQNFC